MALNGDCSGCGHKRGWHKREDPQEPSELTKETEGHLSTSLTTTSATISACNKRKHEGEKEIEKEETQGKKEDKGKEKEKFFIPEWDEEKFFVPEWEINDKEEDEREEGKEKEAEEEEEIPKPPKKRRRKEQEDQDYLHPSREAIHELPYAERFIDTPLEALLPGLTCPTKLRKALTGLDFRLRFALEMYKHSPLTLTYLLTSHSLQ